MMSLKVPRVVLQEACPDALRKHAVQRPGIPDVSYILFCSNTGPGAMAGTLAASQLV